MKEFVEYVAAALVDHPEEVAVTRRDGEKTVRLELRLNPADIGRVIGRDGRTIRSIRALLASAAAKENLRAALEIIE